MDWGNVVAPFGGNEPVDGQGLWRPGTGLKQALRPDGDSLPVRWSVYQEDETA